MFKAVVEGIVRHNSEHGWGEIVGVVLSKDGTGGEYIEQLERGGRVTSAFKIKGSHLRMAGQDVPIT